MKKTLAFVITLLASSCLVRADVLYTDETTWLAAVTGATAVNFEGIVAPHSCCNYYGTGPGSQIVVGATTFSIGAGGANDALFLAGDGVYSPEAVLSAQHVNSFGQSDFNVILPSTDTAVGIQFSTLMAGNVTVVFSDGSSTTVAAPASTLEFVGVTGSSGISTLELTDSYTNALNIGVVEFGQSTVPETSTLGLLFGALCSVALARKVRRCRA